MATRFPRVGGRLGLGVGLDVPWGGRFGFERRPDGTDGAPARLRRFLDRHQLSHVFVSWQPKNRSRLRMEDYAEAWDDFFSAGPPERVRALHQTCLNLGALESYRRDEILDFTNALIERYGLAWVNEDLGIWSLCGRPLPYPQPPILSRRWLDVAVANTAEVQASLRAPLLVEFPGFAEDSTVVAGDMHAYDFFRELVERTSSPATLDTGHLLSYQWLRGRRGAGLFEELDRLPLASCFEIHLSGAAVEGDRFLDLHHGVLLAQQLQLLEILLERCDNLCAITFEDPRPEEDGSLPPASRESFRALAEIVERWLARPEPMSEHRKTGRAAVARSPEVALAAPAPGRESEALDRLLRDRVARSVDRPGDREALADLAGVVGRAGLDGAARDYRASVSTRTYRGSGTLQTLFPRTLTAWRGAHPEDIGLDELFSRFVESAPFAGYRESPGAAPGLCLEEAFWRFARAEPPIDAAVCDREYLCAAGRALLLNPAAHFLTPTGFTQLPGGGLGQLPGLDLAVLVSAGRLLIGRLSEMEASELAPTGS